MSYHMLRNIRSYCIIRFHTISRLLECVIVSSFITLSCIPCFKRILSFVYIIFSLQGVRETKLSQLRPPMSRLLMEVIAAVLFCTVLYCAVVYCTVLYCTVLYCTVLYCTVLYYTVLYCLDCSALFVHFLIYFIN